MSPYRRKACPPLVYDNGVFAPFLYSEERGCMCVSPL